MEFGILFTSHPNAVAEPYPHRDVHARVTREIVRADELGFDFAWVAEHHFSNQYGIMPDVFVYAGYLAALTKRIKIGTAVVTLPLANPLRVVENAAFVDILSNGRFALALAAPAIASGRKVAFDEYHHGIHPTTDVLVLLTRTWPGRALMFVAIAFFLYLVASGRRLGPSIPLDPRPPRSSLEYIRGFAGLLRRSGKDEIARERLRRDLRLGLATRYGLDPATPLDRILATAEADDPGLAAEARATDSALAGRLRQSELLRTVARVEGIVAKKERR